MLAYTISKISFAQTTLSDQIIQFSRQLHFDRRLCFFCEGQFAQNLTNY